MASPPGAWQGLGLCRPEARWRGVSGWTSKSWLDWGCLPRDQSPEQGVPCPTARGQGPWSLFMKEGEGPGPWGSEGRCQEGPSLRSSWTPHKAEHVPSPPPPPALFRFLPWGVVSARLLTYPALGAAEPSWTWHGCPLPRRASPSHASAFCELRHAQGLWPPRRTARTRPG